MKSVGEKLISLSLVMLIVLSILPVKLSTVYAIGNFPVGAIADKAETYADGTWGGQCKQFVNNVVSAVSGGTMSTGGSYQNSFANNGIEVSKENAVRGDIVQITPIGSLYDDIHADSESYYHPERTDSQLHTMIILANNGGGNFSVIQSNYNNTLTVKRTSSSPYVWASGSIIKIWRLGTTSSKPTTASIAISKSTVGVGQNVTFNFSANNSPSFTIGIDKDSTRIDTTSCGTNTTYTRSFSVPGNYSAYVTAWNSAGSVDSSRIYFTVAYLPGAPTLSVASINNSTGKVNFSWSKTSDTTCYDLRILQNGTVIKTIYSITGTTYSYQLPAGNYTAFLCSVNTNYSDWWTKGNDASFSVVTPPGIPSNLLAVSAGFDSVKLTWTPVSGATGYLIYRSASSSGDYLKIGSATTATYTNKGLTTNTTYYYKIRPFVAVRSTYVYGGYTSYVSSKPAPSIATGLKAASTGYSSIKLNWTAVSGATGYLIYRSNTAAGNYVKIGSATTATYTNTGLTTNTTYYYKIKAYKTVGSTSTYGGFSSYVSSKPVPPIPTGLKASSTGYSSIKLNWTATAGATGYLIYRSNTAAGDYVKIGSATTATYTNTGLTANTTYYYKIKAYRTVGSTSTYGGFSSYVSSKPVPSVPTGIKAVSTGYSSVKLTWNAVSGATGYIIYRSTTAAGGYLKIGSVTTANYTNTDLTASTTYYYKIRAYKIVGTTYVHSSYSGATGGTTSSLSIADGNYHVVSMSSSSQVLNGYSDASAAYPWQVTTAPSDGSTEQIFMLSKQADGSYILTIQRYNKALTVNGSISAGSQFVSAAVSSSPSQRFVLTRKSGDYFTVSPYGYPNLVLSKSSTKTYSNTEHYFIQLEEYTGSSNQYWQFSS